MKLLVISSSGDSLPLCAQLESEGVDVSVYIHNPAFRSNYDGMLKHRIPSVDDLIKFVKDSDPSDTTILFDMTRSFDESEEHDVEFLKVRGANEKTSRSPNLFGVTADYFREKGFRVVGNTAWTEGAEMDRKRGKTLAGQIGLEVPDHVVATSLGGAINVLQTRFSSRLAVLKPYGNHHLDTTYIERYPGELVQKLSSPWSERLQWPAVVEQYIDGVTIDEEMWFDGQRFVSDTLNATLERKRFGSGDTGVNVGSSLNLVYPKRISRARVNWTRLEAPLRRCGYIGPVNATMQLCTRTGKAYFLEWAFRFGYDAIFCLSRLLRGTFASFIDSGFINPSVNDDTFCASIRVSVPPYPHDEPGLLREFAAGVPVDLNGVSQRDVRLIDVREGTRGLECAGGDGIVCVSTGVGENPKEAFVRSEHWISKIRIAADLQYRRDWGVIVSDYTSYLRDGPR